MDELLAMIREIGLPNAYDHFAEGETPEPPYLLYLTGGNHDFPADNSAYYKVNEIHLELYTDCKDLSAEAKVEAVLDAHGIVCDRTESWIGSERLFEVLYIFDLEA